MSQCGHQVDMTFRELWSYSSWLIFHSVSSATNKDIIQSAHSKLRKEDHAVEKISFINKNSNKRKMGRDREMGGKDKGHKVLCRF